MVYPTSCDSVFIGISLLEHATLSNAFLVSKERVNAGFV